MLPYLVIGILLLGVLAVAVIVLLIATWRLQLPEVESVELSDYPAEVLERQKHLGARMEEAGFEFVGMQRERRGAKYEVWQALFMTGNGAVWGVAEAAQNERPRIVFHSFFPDGRTVTTSDGEFADYNVTDDWRLTEQKWESLREQATHHQCRSLAAGAKPLALESAEEFRGMYLETARREYARLEELEFLKKDSPEESEFRVVPWKAPAVALRMLLHSRRYQWAEQGRRRNEAHQEELAADEAERKKYRDVAEYKYIEFYKRDKNRGTVLSLLGWTLRGAILFISIMLLLVISLANGSLEPLTVGIILGVLLVHELGHVAMMRVFGFRDYNVLFVPLVGRLAGSRTVRVPSWQEFVVLLMGPLPGLLVGWGLLVLAYFVPGLPEFWKEVGFWAALINNINFLAVLPYDGGRIVNLLVFERAPALRVIYLLLSGLSVVALVILTSLALGAGAFALLWPFLLIGASAFIALPDNWRLARMAPWAKRNLSPGIDETDALVKAFLIVEQTDSVRALEKRGWTDFVDCVVKFGCSKKLGLLGTAAALLLCFFCLSTPLWVFLGVAVGETTQVRAEHRDLEERIADLAPAVAWRGAVVTKRTRLDLEMLRDNYQDSLEMLYADDLTFAVDEFEYDSRGIFDPSEAIEKVRNLRWDEVSTWIGEEDTEARQDTARVLVEALIGNARDQAEAGSMNGAMTGFSKAYWAISTCEPKTSLGAWIDWLYLEHSLLEEIEKLLARNGIPAQYSRWFADTLRGRPQFEGQKMALLLLYDLQGTSIPYVPPDPSIDDRTVNLGEVFADAGFALRRSEADRDYRRELGEREDSFSFSKIMAATRIVQGLPTREEYRAGIRIAEQWADARAFDLSVLEQLENDGQRGLWQARIARIRRLMHYRLLAAAAFEWELSTRATPNGTPRSVGSGGVPVQASLVRTPGNRFAVASKAPDGTRLVFQLSPQFAVSRRTH